MDNFYITMDVGGTYIKAAPFSPQGELLADIREVPSLASAGREAILQNFSDIICSTAANYPHGGLQGVGFAFPGPFDYIHGISKMQGIGKFDSIYGVSLPDALKSRDHLNIFRSVPFLFLHDVEAFAEGLPETLKQRSLCVCIGTGAGSAFIVDGKVCKERDQGIPENGWIYNLPFKESIIDDYISARGQNKLSLRIFGRSIEGSELERMAQGGDEKALQLFAEFGRNLNEALRPIIDRFRPNTLVFGGQITKSFSHFGKDIENYATAKNIRIAIIPNTSESSMKGLVKAMSRRMK